MSKLQFPKSVLSKISLGQFFHLKDFIKKFKIIHDIRVSIMNHLWQINSSLPLEIKFHSLTNILGYFFWSNFFKLHNTWKKFLKRKKIYQLEFDFFSFQGLSLFFNRLKIISRWCQQDVNSPKTQKRSEFSFETITSALQRLKIIIFIAYFSNFGFNEYVLIS